MLWKETSGGRSALQQASHCRGRGRAGCKRFPRLKTRVDSRPGLGCEPHLRTEGKVAHVISPSRVHRPGLVCFRLRFRSGCFAHRRFQPVPVSVAGVEERGVDTAHDSSGGSAGVAGTNYRRRRVESRRASARRRPMAQGPVLSQGPPLRQESRDRARHIDHAVIRRAQRRLQDTHARRCG